MVRFNMRVPANSAVITHCIHIISEYCFLFTILYALACIWNGNAMLCDGEATIFSSRCPLTAALTSIYTVYISCTYLELLFFRPHVRLPLLEHPTMVMCEALNLFHTRGLMQGFWGGPNASSLVIWGVVLPTSKQNHDRPFWAKTGHFGHFGHGIFSWNIKIRNLHDKTVQNPSRNGTSAWFPP